MTSTVKTVESTAETPIAIDTMCFAGSNAHLTRFMLEMGETSSWPNTQVLFC